MKLVHTFTKTTIKTTTEEGAPFFAFFAKGGNQNAGNARLSQPIAGHAPSHRPDFINYTLPMPRPQSDDLFPRHSDTPDEYILAHVDGGSRGNPGPAGYGVVITDHHRQKIAGLCEYLGHQTNNYAEYSGLLAALDYALQHGHKALKVVSDSELLVKQIRGEYKVKSPALQDLYQRARQMIAKLDWFSIQHVLREKNHEADRLANLAMDKGMGRLRPESQSPTNHDHSAHTASPTRSSSGLVGQEFRGIVRDGVIVLDNATLPEGTRVQIRVRD